MRAILLWSLGMVIMAAFVVLIVVSMFMSYTVGVIIGFAGFFVGLMVMFYALREV